MTDIYPPSLAARECGEILRSSLDLKERMEAAIALSRYDCGGHEIHRALLEGLQDPEGCVRTEAFRGLGRMRVNRVDLPEVALEIRRRLQLEEIGSPVFRAGLKALDRLKDYYEKEPENIISHWQVEFDKRLKRDLEEER